jgi:hypothetical protein
MQTLLDIKKQNVTILKEIAEIKKRMEKLERSPNSKEIDEEFIKVNFKLLVYFYLFNYKLT